jgi:hypothetical protein
MKVLAATRAACAQRMDAEPRYLWPLLATGMRASSDHRDIEDLPGTDRRHQAEGRGDLQV